MIFDTVRRLLGRGFRRSEIAALDRAIDCAGGDSSAKGLTVSEAGVAIIKRFEGCARLRRDGMVEAYPDPGTGGHPWTIGWGATGSDIGPGTVWTQAQCDARLQQDIMRHAREVEIAVAGFPTSQAQFDALVSFHYNTGAIGRATLTRLHKNHEFSAAAGQFGRWNRAGGRVLEGLARRRREEAALYLSGS
ncbi:lysozyme [Qipengyuania marisflavi]|nr:lysozyme [Qipengyuania marisflavi]